MKRYIITVHCEDIIAVVLADDEDDAIDKYYDDKIEEYIAPMEQPEFSAKLEDKQC